MVDKSFFYMLLALDCFCFTFASNILRLGEVQVGKIGLPVVYFANMLCANCSPLSNLLSYFAIFSDKSFLTLNDRYRNPEQDSNPGLQVTIFLNLIVTL